MNLNSEKMLSSCLVVCFFLSGVFVSTTRCEADDSLFINTARSDGKSVRPDYVPPIIGNGSLNMTVDYRGGQTQKAYIRMTPGIYWAGRRSNSVKQRFPLIPFGSFVTDLSLDGEPLGEPTSWSQTLDTHRAFIRCRNDYEHRLSVETEVFVHENIDLVAIRKTFTTKSEKPVSVGVVFKYGYTARGTDCRAAVKEDGNEVVFQYAVDNAFNPLKGTVSVFSTTEGAPSVDKQRAAISSTFTLDDKAPVVREYYIAFSDTIASENPTAAVDAVVGQCRKKGFDGLFEEHTTSWKKYWDESFVRLPHDGLNKTYATSQYHLRTIATRWSFPVGIFPTHWHGRYFGWDETFCFLGLASSNHLDLSKRCPDYRFAGLEIATKRVGHYGRRTHGARYPWETLEDGSDGTPPGFWEDHVFHMSNIALTAWNQYLYSGDKDYLEKTGYPVVYECARFFMTHMLYEDSDGTFFVGKCTDLERLGPARKNPFLTTCGVIYNLQIAAEAAEILGKDAESVNTWRNAAQKLRENLPKSNDMYVPYDGCEEKSIAMTAGLFPYPIFGKEDTLQTNALYDFIKNGRAFGNMYPTGNAVCSWYAGLLATSLASLGDGKEAENFLLEAARGAGCFSELFEINEKDVRTVPWFSTSSGSFAYAINQMLLQCDGDTIRIAPAVPETWKDYSFRLPCYGNLLVDIEIKEGKIVRLCLLPGDPSKETQRLLAIPTKLVTEGRLNRVVVASESMENDRRLLRVNVSGKTDVFKKP